MPNRKRGGAAASSGLLPVLGLEAFEAVHGVDRDGHGSESLVFGTNDRLLTCGEDLDNQSVG